MDSRLKERRKWREAGEEGWGTVEASAVFMFCWAQKLREAV